MPYNTIPLALKRVEQQKKEYEINLRNKTLAFAYIDNSSKINVIEVTFRKENYLHLTGLDYKNIQSQNRLNGTQLPTRAGEFYDRLINDIPSLINDVSFQIGRNANETNLLRGHTEHKLENLSTFTHINFKAEYIGEYNGNLDIDLIVGRNTDAIGIKFDSKQKCFFPKSSLYDTRKHFVKQPYPILAIFSKDFQNPIYKIEYLNKKVSIGTSTFPIEDVRKFDISSFEKNRLNIQVNDIQLNNLFSAYKSGLRNLINKQINEIASLRDETLLDDYLHKTEEFFNSLKTVEEINISKKILENQLDNYNQLEKKTENEKERKEINAKKILIEDELQQLNGKLNSLSSQVKPIVNNTTIGINVTNFSSSDNISLINKKINIPTISLKNLFDNLKKLVKNMFDRIIHYKPKEIGISSNNQSKKLQGKLSWDSFNQADETHNENVVKNPYKVEGCTPISQKVDRPTPNEVKHDNNISKDIDKPKKTTKL